jgi:hypothetical protein
MMKCYGGGGGGGGGGAVVLGGNNNNDDWDGCGVWISWKILWVEIAICKEIYEILETKNIFEQMIENCERRLLLVKLWLKLN